MIDLTTRRHGLESLVGDGGSEKLSADVALELRGAVRQINLRGDPGNDGFRKSAETALGQPLPAEPNTTTAGTHTICWLGPDEWLVLAEGPDAAGLARVLEQALSQHDAAANDVSGGQVLMRLTGSGVRRLLAKGCTLDFHPRVFRPGTCAQSGLAKANVLIRLGDDPDSFDVVVRRSFADYLLRWLRHAA